MSGLAHADTPSAAQPSPYGIVSVDIDGTRLCMEVGGAAVAPLAGVDVGECRQSADQQWSLVPNGQNFQVVAKHSLQCLTIANAATSPGAPLVQYPCNGGSNQQWSVSPSRSGYKLVSAHDALCASAAGASPGSRMVQQRCDEHASQTLYVSAPPELVGALIGMNGGLCIDGGAAGAQAVQRTCDDAPGQQWRIRPNGSAYKIHLASTNLCLGTRDASRARAPRSRANAARMSRASCGRSARQAKSTAGTATRTGTGSSYRQTAASASSCRTPPPPTARI
ncbi:hypothetical protein BMMON2_25160 [Burkholderia mallei]